MKKKHSTTTRRHRLHSFLTILLVVTFLLFSLNTTANEKVQPRLETNATTYALDQPITLTINNATPEMMTQYRLRVSHDGEAYVYNGYLEESTTFQPDSEGIYTFTLEERTTRLAIDTLTLTVIDSNLIEPLGDEAFTNRLVTTDKNGYQLGDPVTIGVNYKVEAFTLRILSPTTVYRYLGTLARTITFTPSEPGAYQVQLIINNHLAEEKRFTVNTPTVTPTTNNTLDTTRTGSSYHSYIPRTNIAYNVRGHDDSVTSANTIIRRDGLVIQSNINPDERYEVELTPHSLKPTRIRFDDLKFNNSLDLGLEEVDPQKNTQHPYAVYALAIDPSRLDFTTGSFTIRAPGNEVYKCTTYNFTTQTCHGEQQLVALVEKGSSITIPFTQTDPLYTFVDTTVSCSCTDTEHGNSGTLACNTFCPVTIDAPGATAESGFVQEIQFVVDLTITDDGCTLSNVAHEGDFDHDTTYNDGDEQNIGSSTTTSSATLTWTATGLPSSGATSFNNLDCDNWPTNCTNYYVYLGTTFDYQAPGKASKDPVVNISLNTLNITWNYTSTGNLTVSLDWPGNDDALNYTAVTFNYTPATTAANIVNCSLYTNDTGWSMKNYSTSVTNNVTNQLNYTFTGGDGSYVWNIWCFDSDGNDKWSANNYTLTIDTTAPSVYNISPANNAIETGATITFEYNVSDATSSVNNCSLYVNGSVEDTDTSITEDTTQSFITSLANGVYTWYVGCYDAAGNLGVSNTVNLTVNKTPQIWNGSWFETSTSNCTGAGSCNIALAQSTDGTTNTRTVTLAGNGFINLLNATSGYMGGGGVYIPSTATIDFSGYFSSETGAGTPYLNWKLYALHDDDSTTQICVYGADDGTGSAAITSGGTSQGTCSPATAITLAATDRLKLVLNVRNTHKTQSTTFTHDWDVGNSFVNITPFQTIGTLSLDLVDPDANVNIAQGETFNMTCQATCTYGYCMDTNVYAQYDDGGGWANIGAAGNLVLASGESNPHYLGNISGNPVTNSTNTTFTINGSIASTNTIRCFANTTLANATGPTTRQVVVGDSSAPNVSLVAPPDETNTSNTTVYLTYFANDSSNIANCTLYVNGTYNQTNSSPVTNPGNNQFLLSVPTGLFNFNWTVHCTDANGYEGNASETWDVHVDTVAPNITLNYPGPAASIGYSTVNFNWTAYDNGGHNMTCDLYIDDSPNVTSITASDGVFVNQTVTDLGVGEHNWSVNCTDNAGLSNVSETRLFNITDAPPTVTLSAPPPNTFDSDGDLVLWYNASDNNGFVNCSLIFDGGYNHSNTTPVLNNQLNNFTLSGVPDGTHTWTVNCTDDSPTGYTDQPAAWTIYVDTVAPNVTIVAPNGTTIASSSVNFQFVMDDATSPNATCALQYNTSSWQTLVTGILALDGATTTEPESGLYDGIYSWNVTCTDLGNHTNTSGLAPFNVSSVPTVNLNAPAPNAYANGASVDFQFTPTDNDGFTNCSLILAGINASTTVNTSPIVNGAVNTITYTGLASGMHTWTIRCYDNGTFVNVYQPPGRLLFIDNEKPTVILHSPVDEQVNSSTVIFNWTADDDQDLTLTCDLWVDGFLNKSGISSPAGSWKNYSLDNIPNGQHNWTVNCTDDAGNWNLTDWENFTVYVPPTVNLTFMPDEYYINYYTDVTFEYLVDANAPLVNCSLYLDGVFNQSNTTYVNESDYNYFFVNYTASDEGAHTWNVYCADTDGLTGSNPTNYTFTIDLGAPNITLNGPAPGSTVGTNNVSFNFTVNDTWSPNATCNVTVDGYPYENNTVFDTNQPSLAYALLSDATYWWNVSCYDLAGNWNISTTRNFTVYAPPNVTLVYPEDFDFVNTTNVTFIYYPEDAYAVAECNITVDNGAYNDSDNAIEEYANNTFFVPGLSEGMHNWTVTCRDSDNNLYTPDSWNFTIDLDPPFIFRYDPQDDSNYTVDSVTYNFTANDTYDENVTCNLTVDSSVVDNNSDVFQSALYETTLNGYGDGYHYWNLTCWDNVPQSNTTNTWRFHMNVTPNVTLDAPANNHWTNSNTTVFTYNVTDNDGFENCTLYVNASPNLYNTTITNDGQNTITNTSMVEGRYNWTVNCTDNGTYNHAYAPSTWFLGVDWTEPTITLLSPGDGNTTSNSTIYFNFSIADNQAYTLNCTLSVDGGSNGTWNDESVGVVLNTTLYNLTPGTHYWNVTCVDQAGNTNTSATWSFTVPRSDLTITSGNITFSNSSPVENQTITLYANVYNIGNSSASNITVQFYRGDPDSGGVQIGTNQTITMLALDENETVSVSYQTIIGENLIYVVVDPPNATDGKIEESDENNNKAYNTLTVGFYNVFSGNTSNVMHVANSALAYVWTWNLSNATGSNVLVTDIDSALNFKNLRALGRNTSGAVAANDFTELDTRLSATSYPDNINTTWTSGGAPKATQRYTLFSRTVSDVPIVNSTTTSNFRTGILWDEGDGGNEYNGTQDVAFITQINESKAGLLGTYDYEAKVPAPLRSYDAGTNAVVFYVELR